MAPPVATGKQGQIRNGINEGYACWLCVYAGICLSAPKPDAELCDKIDAISLAIVEVSSNITTVTRVIMRVTRDTQQLKKSFGVLKNGHGAMPFKEHQRQASIKPSCLVFTRILEITEKLTT